MRIKYKIHTKYVWLCTAIVALLISSCTSGFHNVDPNRPGEDVGDLDNLWGSFLTTMQRGVIPEGANDYQLTEDLFGNVYSGFYASTGNWESGRNSTTYVFPSGWVNRPFMTAYIDFLSSWNNLRHKVDSSSVLFYVGEIVKVEGMHRITDMYGPIPYSQFGVKDPTPYDSQEAVYKSFFNELDHAIYGLSAFDSQVPNSSILENFDLVYRSDLPKWIRFANSLKLRLAVRISGVDKDLAKKYAEEAVNHPYGVMTANSDNALIKSVPELGFNYINPIEYLWAEYKDQCMGATMDSYMNGFNDPRLSAYFSLGSDGVFRGFRNGVANGTYYKNNATISKPNVRHGDDMKWMTAAEVYFLRAEGALRGWNMQGEAEGLYNKGISTSFEQWNAGAADAYIKNSTASPVNYKGVGWAGFGKINASSAITIKWDMNANFDTKLEKIITQKWIALYPLGQEAWSEFRRTNYPKIFPIMNNNDAANVPTDIQVRRIPFPESEYSTNREEVEKAVQLLKPAQDTGGTRLWWDVNTK